ncbi:MAG TPA: hypothetical protein VG815_07830 [Chloroflexota bacterium]|nr:hypothetical protein [Chloroflexota bacterium]
MWGLSAGAAGGLLVQTNGVTSDESGTVLAAGRANKGNGTPPKAILWRGRQTGVPLETVLVRGAGWALRDAVAVSGRMIVGTGRHDGINEAYLLTLP